MVIRYGTHHTSIPVMDSYSLVSNLLRKFHQVLTFACLVGIFSKSFCLYFQRKPGKIKYISSYQGKLRKDLLRN